MSLISMVVRLCVGLFVGAAVASHLLAAPAGSSFTYQGQLRVSGQAANGSFDMRFELFESAQGGAVLATSTASAVPVSDGLFTALLDFGAEVFAGGQAYWVGIGVRPAGAGGAYQDLQPRQRITPVPYALQTLSGAARDYPGRLSLFLMPPADINQMTDGTSFRLVQAISPSPWPPSTCPPGQVAHHRYSLLASGTVQGDTSPGGYMAFEVGLGIGSAPVNPEPQSLVAGALGHLDLAVPAMPFASRLDVTLREDNPLAVQFMVRRSGAGSAALVVEGARVHVTHQGWFCAA